MSDPASKWATLTDIERTALQVAYARSLGSQYMLRPEDNQPYYEDPYATRIVEEYMPAEVRELRWPSASTCNLGPGSPPPWGTFAAARTAALDEKIQQEVQLQPRLTQVVLVGAGMDTRAWRLHCWHPGTHLFEVDTPTMHSFKQRLMGTEAVAVSSRAAVIADASQPQQVEDGLVAAGFQLYAASAAAPTAAVRGEGAVSPAAASDSGSSSGVVPATLWLLEGFIGYLTQDEGGALLTWMACVSAPGSVLLMTPPPTAQMREEVANMQPQQQQGSLGQSSSAGTAEGEEAGSAAAHQVQVHVEGTQKQPAGGDAAAGGAAAAVAGSSGSTAAAAPAGGASPVLKQVHKLHHKTFEELATTLQRVSAAGWRDVHCTTAEEYAAKYRVPRAQAVIRAAM